MLTLRKVFSKEQRALYAAHAPDGLELEDLAILGPISVLKLKFAPEEYGRKLVSELHPDRYVDADDDVREAAERRVRDVNEAFAEIRRERAGDDNS